MMTENDDEPAGAENGADAAVWQQARVKQAMMLDLDIEYHAMWQAQMTELNARKLDDRAFTEARMALLKQWERARRLAQARLIYKFDPKDRPQHMIDKTFRENHDRLGTRLREARAGTPGSTVPGRRTRAQRLNDEIRAVDARSAAPAQTAAAVEPQNDQQALVAQMAAQVEQLSRALGMPNLRTASDDEILTAVTDLCIAEGKDEEYAARFTADLREHLALLAEMEA